MPDNEQLTSSMNDDSADFAVLNTVMRALQPLTEERRRRILHTVMTFFGLGSQHVTSSIPGPAADRPVPGGFSEDRSLTPKEFLLTKRPATELDRVVCLAYYLTHYRDTPHFKTFEISKLNTEAAQIKFSNAARAVDNAAKAGFLVQATKGNKQLSAAGEQYVQALPDRAAAKAAVAHARPRRRSKRTRRQTTGDEQQ